MSKYYIFCFSYKDELYKREENEHQKKYQGETKEHKALLL